MRAWCAETSAGAAPELGRGGAEACRADSNVTDGGRAEHVPVDALLPADSPRIRGEDEEYVRALSELGDPLPPILVHRTTMRVIDGMHRLRAAEHKGAKVIAVRFFEGSDDHAFILAVKANVTNGKPLSQADRTAAAARILHSHPQWSDRRIAGVTGLVASTVASLRMRSTDRFDQSNTRVGRDGRARPLNAAEGRRRAAQAIAERPDAPLREIADVAGVALSTAKDVRDRIRQGKDPVPPTVRKAEVRQQRTGVDAPPRQDEGRLPPRPDTAPLDFQIALPRMSKDPSLHTQTGRALLRLLSAHLISAEERWQRLSDSVPGHRTAVVAQAARACAERWQRFAEELELRDE